ncbi:L-rhamnose mutarotase [Salinibacterium soli]|uniref:L-rhamnose mutarotase n=1 Tax=Antiquaquibacter soli TaxID=3064523 RepID=A0ABT9BJL4_9MICO|nr:L-rhamnose mutarotase [Protaetiibacter sp. WY-16]MDO7880627.1 L-rhamnose mutarotase [Protaetiibacter sp. WY-16]
MERVCFTMLVAAEHRDTYVAMHADPWPELVAELDRTGWQDYSLFLRDDGVLVGYLESPDWESAQRDMAAAEVSPRWSVEMDRLVVPGTVMRWPTLALHLESALGLPEVRAPYRHCAVVDALPEIDDRMLERLHSSGMRNLSVFVRDDGVAVAYGETDSPGIPSWPWSRPSRPLREVFNLDEQLARLGSTR